MALRDKLAARVTPMLEPGEQLQQVFLAQGGVSPWIGNSFGLIGLAAMVKRRIVAVTDRGIVVLEANFNGTSPTKILARVPRGSRIGEVKGIWAKVALGDEKLYVHKRFHSDVRAADGVASS